MALFHKTRTPRVILKIESFFIYAFLYSLSKVYLLKLSLIETAMPPIMSESLCSSLLTAVTTAFITHLVLGCSIYSCSIWDIMLTIYMWDITGDFLATSLHRSAVFFNALLSKKFSLIYNLKMHGVENEQHLLITEFYYNK